MPKRENRPGRGEVRFWRIFSPKPQVTKWTITMDNAKGEDDPSNRRRTRNEEPVQKQEM
jgi:hypothetical protein